MTQLPKEENQGSEKTPKFPGPHTYTAGGHGRRDGPTSPPSAMSTETRGSERCLHSAHPASPDVLTGRQDRHTTPTLADPSPRESQDGANSSRSSGCPRLNTHLAKQPLVPPANKTPLSFSVLVRWHSPALPSRGGRNCDRMEPGLVRKHP